MTLDLNQGLPDGATPLSPDEMEALIPAGITTRTQLNEFEQANIDRAAIWAFGKKRNVSDILTVDFCNSLHRRMLSRVWGWAGEFRRHEVNVGNVDPLHIPVEYRKLMDDAAAWVEFSTYPPDELCMRLHRRMVWIHPYPNGNGRHSRMMADLVSRSLENPRFTWGSSNLVNPTETRTRYLQALRQADVNEFGPLVEFARS